MLYITVYIQLIYTNTPMKGCFRKMFMGLEVQRVRTYIIGMNIGN